MGELKNVVSEYLGDGVYMTTEHGQLVIYTDNGIRRTNQIYVDAEFVEDLVDFIVRAAGPKGIALGSKGLRRGNLSETEPTLHPRGNRK